MILFKKLYFNRIPAILLYLILIYLLYFYYRYFVIDIIYYKQLYLQIIYILRHFYKLFIKMGIILYYIIL